MDQLHPFLNIHKGESTAILQFVDNYERRLLEFIETGKCSNVKLTELIDLIFRAACAGEIIFLHYFLWKYSYIHFQVVRNLLESPESFRNREAFRNLIIYLISLKLFADPKKILYGRALVLKEFPEFIWHLNRHAPGKSLREFRKYRGVYGTLYFNHGNQAFTELYYMRHYDEIDSSVAFREAQDNNYLDLFLKFIWLENSFQFESIPQKAWEFFDAPEEEIYHKASSEIFGIPRAERAEKVAMVQAYPSIFRAIFGITGPEFFTDDHLDLELAMSSIEANLGELDPEMRESVLEDIRDFLAPGDDVFTSRDFESWLANTFPYQDIAQFLKYIPYLSKEYLNYGVLPLSIEKKNRSGYSPILAT